MAETSGPPYLFGDLLALARLSWVRQMADRLSRLGYADYRRSDALALRMLDRGPVSVGRLGTELGVTRQAARKVIDGLEQRGFARTERDAQDSRVLNVILTPAGAAYARAVIEVIYALNREFCKRVDPAHLATADVVLRAVIEGDSALEAAAAQVRRPPSPT
ncbi:MAG: MarR family winged helix-turn-helix transcriptional regulator [Streptosporangiaceae bacterium]